MRWIRRLVFGAGLLVALSFGVLDGAIAAGGGGGGLGPGSYSFTNTGATAFFRSGPPKNGVFLSVNRGLTSFQPEDSDGSGTVGNETVINLSVFIPPISGFGCFILSPSHASDFQVAEDLRSASLRTTLLATDQCPGPPRGLASTGPVPLGGGGGGGGLAFPITLDVTWSWRGVAGYGQSDTQFQCGSYSTQSQDASRSAGADATATITIGGAPVLSGATSNSGGLRTSDTQIDVSGFPLASCFGF